MTILHRTRVRCAKRTDHVEICLARNDRNPLIDYEETNRLRIAHERSKCRDFRRERANERSSLELKAERILFEIDFSLFPVSNAIRESSAFLCKDPPNSRAIFLSLTYRYLVAP